jgi:hypothetical protein
MHPTLRTAIGGILDGMQLHISFEQEEHRREGVQEFRREGVQEFRRIPLSISHSESDLTSACSRVSHLCL